MSRANFGQGWESGVGPLDVGVEDGPRLNACNAACCLVRLIWLLWPYLQSVPCLKAQTVMVLSQGDEVVALMADMCTCLCI